MLQINMKLYNENEGAVGVLLTTKYYALGLDVLKDTNTFKPVQDEDVIGRDYHNDASRVQP